MRVLVTGARGKVGAATVAALLRAGHEVTASDRHPPAFEAPRPGDAHYVQADVADAGDAFALVRGHDAVVHAAALPEPTRNPAHTVFQNNVMATFNTLEAAVRFGVGRFVHVSSETVPGFFFPERPFLPDYAPIDEEHPVRPQDPYALAKHVGEQLMDAATRRSDMRAISIRPSWVQWEGNIEQNLGPIVRGPAGPSAGLWSYIDAYDLADALRLTAESELGGHEVVYIASPDNVAGRPLAELVHEHYGDAIELRPLDRPDASGISIAKARRLLGYDPRRSWRDYLDDDGRLRPEARERLERGETGVQAGRAADAG
jgi:UDP-glucose 4-epimerase